MDSSRRSRYMNQVYGDKDSYIDINLDMHSLEMLCKMVVSQNRAMRRTQLVNIAKLISLIDPAKYSNDPDKIERINFIKKGIEARVGLNIEDPYMIVQHVNGGILSDDIIDLDNYKDCNTAEVDAMNNMVSETLKYATIYNSVDEMMDICTRFKTKDYGTKKDIVEEFQSKVNDIQNEFRRNRNEARTDMTFSLQDGQFEDCVTETYNRAANPRRKLITGMQAVNELLGGGFESGRIYIFFGLPGEGKSTTLLNLLYQIKKYNRNYQCKDPTKQPCIVLLTMENTVEESIERLFGLATDRDNMTEFDLNSVIKMLREEGELTISTDDPIDIIIKYMPTNSVDTGYCYTLTDDLEDQGYEVILFAQDYIGRIRSTQRFADTRLEYGSVVDEFKVYCQAKDIPFISVSQLNRDASKRIDDGRQTNKIDLVRALGRSNISESLLILNNIDGGFMITPEYTNTGEKYLGMMRVKIRYSATELDVVYLPYSNNNRIKLIEDFGKVPVWKKTLRTATLGIPTRPSYENDIEEIGSADTGILNTSIFNTKVVSSSDNFNDLEASFRPLLINPVTELINPIEFIK